ncbi:uncharacterized protein LOC123696182 [Colias croceus]|uniref:uncharacterized protein LOC123696182 n=1 Tax=Colias crocea TaxID=72248 RepID=UPI001E2805B1|nr:uncharacterized protein LOC123696182 [Colias croceus]
MFTALFGKRRSSPVEDETPPIPGPKADDGFVVIDPNASGGGGLYPSVSGVPYPPRPAPPLPGRRPHRIDPTFHYLQGVPFSLSRELQMSANKDAFATEIGDLLAFLTNKMNMSAYNYDFSAEKSVLKEC